MKPRFVIPVLFLAVLACGVCLPGGSVQADDKPITLDPGSGSILGVRLGMGEKKVRRVLKNAGVAKVERVDYPRHFVLQAPELHPSIQGGLAFYFEDGKTLTKVYSNAKKIRIATNPVLSAGMPLLVFEKALGDVKDIELLPNRKSRATHFDFGSFRLEAISDAVSGKVSAWSLKKR